MKKIYTRLSTIGFFIVLAASLHAQTLIYSNNFSPGQTTWGNYDDESTNSKLEGGKYVLTHKKDSYSYMGTGTAVTIDNNRNYSVETVANHITGTDRYPMGLVFGATD